MRRRDHGTRRGFGHGERDHGCAAANEIEFSRAERGSGILLRFLVSRILEKRLYGMKGEGGGGRFFYEIKKRICVHKHAPLFLMGDFLLFYNFF